MSKYYITNGDGYLTEAGNEIVIGGPITQAKRFKVENASSVLSAIKKSHPEYCVQKYYSSASNIDYVITNASKFVGDNNTVVGNVKKARQFKTAADADGYLRSHGEATLGLGDPIIVNESYEPVDILGRRIDLKSAAVKITTEKKQPKTVRVQISKDKKIKVYNRDGGVCKLCGKKLTQEDYTIDHIVPVSRGGTNQLSNLRCLCERCNKLKADDLDPEMIENIWNIGARYLYDNPNSELSKRLIRAMVRGYLQQC